MSHPQNLRASVNKLNTYVGGSTLLEPEFGFFIQEGGVQHKILCQLTERVITALRTQRAAAAFKRIAEYWRRQHKPDLDAEGAARDFQKLLEVASNDQRQWPTIIIGWAIPPQIGATHIRGTISNQLVSDFSPEDQYIALNGIVSALDPYIQLKLPTIQLGEKT
jgi:hypothetical protein